MFLATLSFTLTQSVEYAQGFVVLRCFDLDCGGVCCLCIEIFWICFFLLEVNVVCCGRVADKIFQWMDLSKSVFIIKRILMCGLVGGCGGIFGVFLVITYMCFFGGRGMVGRAYCAFFDMVRDNLFLECMGTCGAVGVTEHIAWFFVLFFSGERRVKYYVFCACNLVLIVCVLTLSVAVAGYFFILLFIRHVVVGRLLVWILLFIVGGKDCISFLYLFVLICSANLWGVVVVDYVMWCLDVMSIISKRKTRSWLVGRIVCSVHFTIFNMFRDVGVGDLFF